MFARVFKAAHGDSANRPALIDRNVVLTFGQVAAVSRNIAKIIQIRAIEPKKVVAVLLERSALYIASMIGVMSTGCVYLPLNSADPVDRIKGIIEDSGASLVLTDTTLQPTAEKICSTPPAVLNLNDLFGPVDINLPVIRSDDPCYMIFTSGTTGKPKGVVVPHLAISNLTNELDANFSDATACLALFEFSFDAHLHDVALSLARGSTLVISKPLGNKDPKYIVDMIHQHKISCVSMVPSMLSMLLGYLDSDPSELARCSSLRMIGCGGEVLHVKLAERCKSTLKVRVINNYGPTETCVLCSYYVYNGGTSSSMTEVVPIGNAIRNTEMLILGEDKSIVPLGVTGQLYIGGQCLALGYANNPQQTESKFVPHPYKKGAKLYASGDLAKYLPNGDIHFLGRSDNQIKLRGYRIECGEIEAAILSNNQVKQSCVIAFKSEQREMCLIGYAVVDTSVTDKSKSLSDIMSDLKSRVPHYMVPTRIVCVDVLPLTSHGKVDTKRLPDPFTAEFYCDQNTSNSAKSGVPLGPVEKSIAQCFADVLSIAIDRIGSDSNFFDLGGTSLHTFTLVTKIKTALNVKLELQQFFDHPTPSALANLFKEDSESQDSQQALERYKPRPLTHYECVKLKEATFTPAINIFLVHGAFRSSLVFKDMAARFPNYVTVYAFQDSKPLDEQETDDDQPSTMEQFADLYVQQILKTQPNGIYHLAGYCFGGVLACEMAHQMLQKGCNVCTLALIDTTAPSVVNARGLSNIKAPTIFRMISLEIGMSLTQQQIDLSEEIFSKCKTTAQQKAALIDAFKSNVDSKTLIPFVDRCLQHFASSSGLLTNYQFKPLRGRVTLFSAEKPWALYHYYNPNKTADLGWMSLHENLEVVDTPGDHLTIVRDADAIESVVSYLVNLFGKEGGYYLKLPSIRETLNLQNVLKLNSLEERVPNDCLNITLPESGPINPVIALHRAVYHGLMAPSGHNIQPWKFIVDEVNLALIVCFMDTRIPPFFQAADKHGFYDRVGIGAALFVIKQLLQSYGFSVKEKVLSAPKTDNLEPLVSLHITPSTGPKPAIQRQQSTNRLSPVSVPRQDLQRKDGNKAVARPNTSLNRSSPALVTRQQAVKHWEQVVTQRVTNRHNYSKRRVVPVRLLQQLQEDPVINQPTTRPIIINDFAVIEMIAKWAEEMDSIAYLSEETRKGFIGNLGHISRAHSIPVDSLELGAMQTGTISTILSMDENTLLTMRVHKSLGNATAQKIYNSGGLIIFVGSKDSPRNKLALDLGSSIMATMLKFTEHGVAMHPWTNPFALAILLNDPEPSPIGQKIKAQLLEHTPDMGQRFGMLRAIVPQIGQNEDPLLLLRFGYPDEEVSGHATRLPASDSVQIIKKGDSIPTAIASCLKEIDQNL